MEKSHLLSAKADLGRIDPVTAFWHELQRLVRQSSMLN